MRWDDLNLDICIWTQKDTKTGNTHLVPLSEQTLDILKSRPRINEWVFPAACARGKKEAAHTVCTNSARIKLQELSGVFDSTAHDLRRTARTILSRLDIKHHIRERVLNHSPGKIQATYDQHDYLQEKSDALDKLGREIARIVGVDVEPAKWCLSGRKYNLTLYRDRVAPEEPLILRPARCMYF